MQATVNALIQRFQVDTPSLRRCLSSFFTHSQGGKLSVKLSDLEEKEALSLLPPSFLSNTEKTALVLHQERLYTQRNFIYETKIVQNIQRLRNTPPFPLFDPVRFSNALSLEKGLTLEQKSLLEEAFHSSFSIFSGGPGTGKTYTAARLIPLLLASLREGETLFWRLSAPTGKAAMHLQAALGNLKNGETLHRLLSLRPDLERKFSPKKIDADLVLVDEASMIDVFCFAHLLEGTRTGARLILMGDPDQLPPVESASLFRDLTSLFAKPLTHCIRTDDPSLKTLALLVREGKKEELSSLLKPLQLPWNFDSSLKDFLFEKIAPLEDENPIDPEKAIIHFQRLRVLNALRQGPFGCQSLNTAIFERLETKKNDGYIAVPIMVTANDPRLHLYNGMIGVVIKRRREPLKNGLFYFPDRKEPIRNPPPFELAFCLSIHKSQGSEFEEVIALFPQGSERFGKECLYTAITRAKAKFSWVAQESSLLEMASRSSENFLEIRHRF